MGTLGSPNGRGQIVEAKLEDLGWNAKCKGIGQENVVRLLIVGDSQLVNWVVRHLVPEEVVVENAATRNQVREAFNERCPDAVLLDVKRADGPWLEVARRCQGHRPPIPFLVYAGVELDPAEVGIEVDDRSLFTEHLAAGDLDRLIRAASAGARVAARRSG